jgi:hypothetical protein
MRRADGKRPPGVAVLALLAQVVMTSSCQTRNGNDEPAHQALDPDASRQQRAQRARWLAGDVR